MFKQLGHPDRVRLIEELRGGEKAVGELAEALSLPATRVSQHLAQLKAHRLVEERREGRQHFYHLTDASLADWVANAVHFIEGRVPIDPQLLHAALAAWLGV
nr:metalloregulator ArsR/SmtB family transcription factor [Parvularcula dongshanensis]